ncbi:uncharacterized protein LDX57_007827 [Aspergillus melleus]|uniref:uncharacterized protein n=1 Tax=Aspergillus melleus TaxID=138277 RepID=UPI001E8EE32A|nr:uncharacterized protein LDX57_007827 [Aspergillus melleus]KAH8430157.1 hypothetical protein LDX57_007827 [Aspergillus melleus]
MTQAQSPRGTGKSPSTTLEVAHAECFRTIEELERENQALRGEKEDLQTQLQEAQNFELSDRMNTIVQQMQEAISNFQRQLWDLEGTSALPDATALGNMWTDQEGMGDMEDPNLSTEDMMNLTSL